MPTLVLPLTSVTYATGFGSYTIPAVALHSWGGTTVYRQVDDLHPHPAHGASKFLERHGIWVAAAGHAASALTHNALVAELRPKVARIPNLKAAVLTALAGVGPGCSFDSQITTLIQSAVASLQVAPTALTAGMGEAWDVPACVAVAVAIGWAEELRYPTANGYTGPKMHSDYLAKNL